jgi:hypothetical protein
MTSEHEVHKYLCIQCADDLNGELDKLHPNVIRNGECSLCGEYQTIYLHDDFKWEEEVE